jgi:hypothetical protein
MDVVTLYFANLGLPLEPDKTWEVPYTKVDYPPLPGNEPSRTKGPIQSALYEDLSRQTAGNPPRGQSPIGVPTKVDLHVCHVTGSGNKSVLIFPP